jgi:hypothetical protein
MPTPSPAHEVTKIILPKGGIPPPYTSWCEWAQANLAKAQEGMVGASSGVEGYGIGSRWVRYAKAGDQNKLVEYWSRMVMELCGEVAVPMIGADSAVRVIPRDV